MVNPSADSTLLASELALDLAVRSRRAHRRDLAAAVRARLLAIGDTATADMLVNALDEAQENARRVA